MLLNNQFPPAPTFWNSSLKILETLSSLLGFKSHVLGPRALVPNCHRTACCRSRGMPASVAFCCCVLHWAQFCHPHIYVLLSVDDTQLHLLLLAVHQDLVVIFQLWKCCLVFKRVSRKETQVKLGSLVIDSLPWCPSSASSPPPAPCLPPLQGCLSFNEGSLKIKKKK